MSYLNYHCKKDPNKKVMMSESIQGTCMLMCPKEEIILREREKLIHTLEVIGPTRKLIKSFSRSAADSKMAVPSFLRPYSVLKETVVYLLSEVIKRTDVPVPVLYDFIDDRLRAVRQDMTIQRLPPKECVILLEPMIRFYVYFGYLLCELPVNRYNPVLNKKYLLECLKWFLTCCDKTADEKEDSLSNNLKNLNISTKGKEMPCDRALVESLYILCNLYDTHPLHRYFNLPKELKSDPSICRAYRIAIENLRGNFVKVCRLMNELCTLTYCAVSLYLPTIQRRALQVLSCAYSSRQLLVPFTALRSWLRYDSAGDAAGACAHYGLGVCAGAVAFRKDDFNYGADLLSPRKSLMLGDQFNMTVDHVFNYVTEK